MWEVIGFMKVTGTTKSTGEVYQGFRIYLRAIRPREGVVGEEVDSVFYKLSYIPYTPNIGDRIAMEKGQYGPTRIDVM